MAKKLLAYRTNTQLSPARNKTSERRAETLIKGGCDLPGLLHGLAGEEESEERCLDRWHKLYNLVEQKNELTHQKRDGEGAVFQVCVLNGGPSVLWSCGVPFMTVLECSEESGAAKYL